MSRSLSVVVGLSIVFNPLDKEKRGPHTVFLHAAPGQLFLLRLGK